MAEKSGAYGNKAADTDFRKKWDKEEYAERARKKDQEEKERMQENEDRMKQGMSHPLIIISSPYAIVLCKERDHERVDVRTYLNRRSS